MSQIKNPQQFAAIEYCLQHYFTEELAPVMKQVKDELNRKQVKELPTTNAVLQESLPLPIQEWWHHLLMP